MRVKNVVFDEQVDETGLGESGGLGGLPEGEQEPSPFIRDLNEDTVYSRLQSVDDFPRLLSATESRMAGRFGPLMERLQGLEKSMPTQAQLDTKLLDKLDEYDPKLGEVLKEILPQLVSVSPTNEDTLRPFLEPLRNEMQDMFQQMLVQSFYSPDRIAEMIPGVENDAFAPKNDEQEDFVKWIGQQGYETQQALAQASPQFIHALKQFESWRAGQLKERDNKAGEKTSRLANGQQPASKGRKSAASKLSTEEDGFLSVFK